MSETMQDPKIKPRLKQVAEKTFRIHKSWITDQDITDFNSVYNIKSYRIYRSGYGVTLEFKTK